MRDPTFLLHLGCSKWQKTPQLLFLLTGTATMYSEYNMAMSSIGWLEEGYRIEVPITICVRRENYRTQEPSI